MFRYNPTLNRIEFINLDGEVVGVWPPEAIQPDEAADGVEEMPLDDTTRAAFERYRAGDQSAAPLLQQSLQAANQQTAAVVRDSLARGQDNTAPATARPGERVGVLQTPGFLNAQLNVAETALNTEDAFQKLAIEEAGVLAAAREAGLGDLFTADYFKGRYGDVQNGHTGPFPADPQAIQTRLNSAQANDPDYINYINRVGGVTAAAEINRRQNILADAKQKIAGASAQKERLQGSDDIARKLSEMDEDRMRDIIDITSSGDPDAQRKLDKYERDFQVTKERLENALWRSMADADPARAVAYFAGREQPKSGNAIFGTGEANTTPPPTTSKGPPTEGINLAAAYGTRDRFGTLTYPGREQGIFEASASPMTPGAPPAPASPTPAKTEGPKEQPPYAAPPGQRWVNEMGRWVLKDITEYQPETPAFEEGGYYGEPGTSIYYGGGGDYGSAPAQKPPEGSGGPVAPPPPPAAPPQAGGSPGGATTPEGEDPGTDTPMQEEPLAAQPQSDEEMALAQQIGAVQAKAKQELQEFNMARQRLAQQAQLLRESEQRRIADAQSRSADAGAQFQARLLQLDAQMREAIAQNPFAARQLRAIVRPGMGAGGGGPLLSPGGRFDAVRQNINQAAPVI